MGVKLFQKYYPNCEIEEESGKTIVIAHGYDLPELNLVYLNGQLLSGEEFESLEQDAEMWAKMPQHMGYVVSPELMQLMGLGLWSGYAADCRILGGIYDSRDKAFHVDLYGDGDMQEFLLTIPCMVNDDNLMKLCRALEHDPGRIYTGRVRYFVLPLGFQLSDTAVFSTRKQLNARYLEHEAEQLEAYSAITQAYYEL